MQGGYCHIGIMEIRETGILTGTGHGTVEVRSDGVAYVATTGNEILSPVNALDGQWHDIAVAHCYARQETLLFVDGVEAGSAVEQIVPVSFVLGGEGFDGFSNRLVGPLTAQITRTGASIAPPGMKMKPQPRRPETCSRPVWRSVPHSMMPDSYSRQSC